MPIFLLMLAGVADFGIGLYSQMALVNATREGARMATIDADPSTISQIALASVQAAATGLTTANVTVTATCVPIVSTSCDFAAASDSKRGDGVSITATYPYTWIWPIHIHTPFLKVDLFTNPLTLSSTVQMIRQ